MLIRQQSGCLFLFACLLEPASKERASGKPSNLFVSHGIKWRTANMEQSVDKELWRLIDRLGRCFLVFWASLPKNLYLERATERRPPTPQTCVLRHVADCCGLACVVSASPRSSRMAGQTQAPCSPVALPCLPLFPQCYTQPQTCATLLYFRHHLHGSYFVLSTGLVGTGKSLFSMQMETDRELAPVSVSNPRLPATDGPRPPSLAHSIFSRDSDLILQYYKNYTERQIARLCFSSTSILPMIPLMAVRDKIQVMSDIHE